MGINYFFLISLGQANQLAIYFYGIINVTKLFIYNNIYDTMAMHRLCLLSQETGNCMRTNKKKDCLLIFLSEIIAPVHQIERAKDDGE